MKYGPIEATNELNIEIKQLIKRKNEEKQAETFENRKCAVQELINQLDMHGSPRWPMAGCRCP